MTKELQFSNIEDISVTELVSILPKLIFSNVRQSENIPDILLTFLVFSDDISISSKLVHNSNICDISSTLLVSILVKSKEYNELQPENALFKDTNSPVLNPDI